MAEKTTLSVKGVVNFLSSDDKNAEGIANTKIS